MPISDVSNVFVIRDQPKDQLIDPHFLQIYSKYVVTCELICKLISRYIVPRILYYFVAIETSAYYRDCLAVSNSFAVNVQL